MPDQNGQDTTGQYKGADGAGTPNQNQSEGQGQGVNIPPAGSSVPKGATPNNPMGAVDKVVGEANHQPRTRPASDCRSGTKHVHPGYGGKEWWNEWHCSDQKHKGPDGRDNTLQLHEAAGLGKDGKGGTTSQRSMGLRDRLGEAKREFGEMREDMRTSEGKAAMKQNAKAGLQLGAAMLAKNLALSAGDLTDAAFGGLRRAMKAMMSPNPLSASGDILCSAVAKAGDTTRRMEQIQRKYGIGSKDPSTLEGTIMGRMMTREQRAVQQGTSDAMGRISEAIDASGAEDISTMNQDQLKMFQNSLNADMVPLMQELYDDEHLPSNMRMPATERRRKMAMLEAYGRANDEIGSRAKDIKSTAKEYAARLAHEERYKNKVNAELRRQAKVKAEQDYQDMYSQLPEGAKLAKTLQGRKVALGPDGIAINKSQRTAQKNNLSSYADHIEALLRMDEESLNPRYTGTEIAPGVTVSRETVDSLRGMVKDIETRERDEKVMSDNLKRQQAIARKNNAPISAFQTIQDSANVGYSDQNQDSYGVGTRSKNTPSTRDAIRSELVRMERSGDPSVLSSPEYAELKSAYAAYSDNHILHYATKQMNDLLALPDSEIEKLGNGANRASMEQDLADLEMEYGRLREASPLYQGQEGGWQAFADNGGFRIPDEEAEKAFAQKVHDISQRYRRRESAKVRPPRKEQVDESPVSETVEGQDGDAGGDGTGGSGSSDEIPDLTDLGRDILGNDFDGDVYTVNTSGYTDATGDPQYSVSPYENLGYEYPEFIDTSSGVPTITDGAPVPQIVTRRPQSAQDVKDAVDDLANRYGISSEGRDFDDYLQDVAAEAASAGDVEGIRNLMAGMRYLYQNNDWKMDGRPPEVSSPLAPETALRNPISIPEEQPKGQGWSDVPTRSRGRGNSEARTLDNVLQRADKGKLRVSPQRIEQMIRDEPQKLSAFIDNYNRQGWTGLAGVDHQITEDTAEAERRLQTYGIDASRMSAPEIYGALYDEARKRGDEDNMALAVRTANALDIRNAYGRVRSPKRAEEQGEFAPYAYREAPQVRDVPSEVVEEAMNPTVPKRRTEADRLKQEQMAEQARRADAEDWIMKSLMGKAEELGLDVHNARDYTSPEGLAGYIKKHLKDNGMSGESRKISNLMTTYDKLSKGEITMDSLNKPRKGQRGMAPKDAESVDLTSEWLKDYDLKPEDRKQIMSAIRNMQAQDRTLTPDDIRNALTPYLGRMSGKEPVETKDWLDEADLPDDLRKEARASYKELLGAGFSEDEAREVLESALSGKEAPVPKGRMTVSGDIPSGPEDESDGEPTEEPEEPETAQAKPASKTTRESRDKANKYRLKKYREIADMNGWKIDTDDPDRFLTTLVGTYGMSNKKGILRDIQKEAQRIRRDI